MTKNCNEVAQQVLIRRQTVQSMTGLPRSSLYDKIRQGRFPKPIKLGGGRSSAWVQAEVLDWIDQQIKESRGDGK